MFSVIFEVHPKPNKWDAYLDNAKMLRPELDQVDGFVDNIRYKSLSRDGWLLSLSSWRDEKSADLPWWARLARTLGFIAGLAGAILLYRRSRHAFLCFAGFLCALALGTIGEQIIGLPESLRTGHMLAAKFGNWILAIGTVLYTHWMRVAEVLR